LQKPNPTQRMDGPNPCPSLGDRQCCDPFVRSIIRVSYPVRSFDDLMNWLPVLPSLVCQCHHLWQIQACPVGNIIHQLSSLPALSASPRHESQGWMARDMTKVPQFLSHTLSSKRLWLISVYSRHFMGKNSPLQKLKIPPTAAKLPAINLFSSAGTCKQ